MLLLPEERWGEERAEKVEVLEEEEEEVQEEEAKVVKEEVLV